MVLVGQLDNELDSIELRIGKLLEKLPAKVNTENLEELRKVKGILVELESKSEQVTELLADFLEVSPRVSRFPGPLRETERSGLSLSDDFLLF